MTSRSLIQTVRFVCLWYFKIVQPCPRHMFRQMSLMPGPSPSPAISPAHTYSSLSTNEGVEGRTPEIIQPTDRFSLARTHQNA